jgi:FkbM family methyltransferase
MPEYKKDKKTVEDALTLLNFPRYIGLVSAKHGVFAYNRNDNMIGKSLEKYGEWCGVEVDFLTSLLSEGDIAIDVGAYIGTHTIPFAKKVGLKGRVVSFEPQRFHFHNLCTNIYLNGLLNTICYQLALGEREAKLFVPVFDPNQQENFGAIKLKKFSAGEEIQIIPLDYLKLTECKLIKIDVEGMEVEVLEGARKLTQGCKPFLYIENNTIQGSTPILKQLASLNYRAYWTIETYYNSKNFFEESENIFGALSEANLFCIHNDIPLKVPKLEPTQGFDDNWQKALMRQLHR